MVPLGFAFAINAAMEGVTPRIHERNLKDAISSHHLEPAGGVVAVPFHFAGPQWRRQACAGAFGVSEADVDDAGTLGILS
jgi:hypothetical protein